MTSERYHYGDSAPISNFAYQTLVRLPEGTTHENMKGGFVERPLPQWVQLKI